MSNLEKIFQGDRLRLLFFRNKDRLGHRVEWIPTIGSSPSSSSAWQPLWESIEGDDTQNWPSSPPLKEIQSIDGQEGRQLALLVGMAGKSHWSLSIEFSAQANWIEWDVACRLKDSPQYLGSEYLMFSSVPLKTAPPETSILRADGWELLLGGSKGPQGEEIQFSSTPPQTRMMISPIQTFSKFPDTARWKYRLQILG